jgi:hypothetical protein
MPGLLERRGGSKLEFGRPMFKRSRTLFVGNDTLSRVPDIHTLDIKILGTDIDPKI